MIQTPQEFADGWTSTVKDDSTLANAITERDAAIRLEAREEHRLEVVGEIEAQAATWERQCFDQHSAVNQFTLELKNKLSLQPTKPKVHPRALKIAQDFIVAHVDGEDKLNEKRNVLAALISSEVAEWVKE